MPTLLELRTQVLDAIKLAAEDVQNPSLRETIRVLQIRQRLPREFSRKELAEAFRWLGSLPTPINDRDLAQARAGFLEAYCGYRDRRHITADTFADAATALFTRHVVKAWDQKWHEDVR